MSQQISQNYLPRNPNFWSTFNVPTGLGLLDEDFELPEEPEEQSPQTNNNVDEEASPVMQTQRLTQQLPLLSRTLPTGNNSTLMEPYSPTSPTSPNDRTIINFITPPSPFTQQIPPSNSRYYYPPTYMPSHYYNPHMLSDPEYISKVVAEEDKKRRNTAASARFRIKKKMREQALEKTARDMTAKAEMLENRVKELEREIKWLKNLLIEKDSRVSSTLLSDYNEHKDGGNKIRDNNLPSASDQQHQK